MTGAQITNPGLEYDVAPEVLFKATCDNPGVGAKGYAEITNGKVTNVVITDGGSGYTDAPEIIFAKKYEIIEPYILFTKDIVIDIGVEVVMQVLNLVSVMKVKLKIFFLWLFRRSVQKELLMLRHRL